MSGVVALKWRRTHLFHFSLTMFFFPDPIYPHPCSLFLAWIIFFFFFFILLFSLHDQSNIDEILEVIKGKEEEQKKEKLCWFWLIIKVYLGSFYVCIWDLIFFPSNPQRTKHGNCSQISMHMEDTEIFQITCIMDVQIRISSVEIISILIYRWNASSRHVYKKLWAFTVL